MGLLFLKMATYRQPLLHSPSRYVPLTRRRAESRPQYHMVMVSPGSGDGQEPGSGSGLDIINGDKELPKIIRLEPNTYRKLHTWLFSPLDPQDSSQRDPRGIIRWLQVRLLQGPPLFSLRKNKLLRVLGELVKQVRIGRRGSRWFRLRCRRRPRKFHGVLLPG